MWLKGAPDVLLARATRWITEDGEQPLDGADAPHDRRTPTPPGQRRITRPGAGRAHDPYP